MKLQNYSTVIILINARGVYLIHRLKRGAFIRGGVYFVHKPQKGAFIRGRRLKETGRLLE